VGLVPTPHPTAFAAKRLAPRQDFVHTLSAMAFRVFLVHGTFAKEAEWTLDKSPLREHLRRDLPDIHICTTPWTGRNSTRARHTGVQTLSTQLRDSLAANPFDQHVVIGHSHGGTIAFQAVNSAEFVERVPAVLLSTPVLTPRKRQLSDRLKWAFASSAYFSTAIVLGTIGGFLNLPPNLIVLPSMITAGVVIYVLYTYLLRETNFIIDHNNVKALESIRMLIVREAADEASSFLGAVQLGTRVINILFSGIEGIADRVGEWSTGAAKQPFRFRTLAPNAVLVLMATGVLSTLLHSFNDALHLSLSTFWTMVVLSLAGVGLCFNRRAAVDLANYGYSVIFVLLAMIFCMPAFPIWLVVSLLAFPIRESILSAAFVDVSPETTPEGEWRLVHYLPTENMFKGWRLAHSAAHDDPRVFELIVKWIKAGFVPKAGPLRRDCGHG